MKFFSRSFFDLKKKINLWWINLTYLKNFFDDFLKKNLFNHDFITMLDQYSNSYVIILIYLKFVSKDMKLCIGMFMVIG